MRIIRFKTQNTPPQFGWIRDGRVGVIQGDPFSEFRRFEETYELSDVTLLLPCLPSKIIAVGRNYSDLRLEILPGYAETPIPSGSHSNHGLLPGCRPGASSATPHHQHALLGSGLS